MEREVGGGIGMGNTCKPMAVSFQCMTKFTTNKKRKKERKESARTHCLAHGSLFYVAALMGRELGGERTHGCEWLNCSLWCSLVTITTLFAKGLQLK